jgi:hypothetical protein
VKKILSLAIIGGLSLALINPAFADSGRRGWHRGGQSHGGHRGGGHVGRWFPGALLGGLVVGSVIAATTPRVYYPYPEPVYVPPPSPIYPQPQVYVAPVPRESCYASGCYRLYGDGVTAAYQWVWMPNPVAPAPPGPPPPPLAPPQQ